MRSRHHRLRFRGLGHCLWYRVNLVLRSFCYLFSLFNKHWFLGRLVFMGGLLSTFTDKTTFVRFIRGRFFCR